MNVRTSAFAALALTAALGAPACTRQAGEPPDDAPTVSAQAPASPMRNDRGSPRRRGAGGGGLSCDFGSGPLPDPARVAVERALADERVAEATYARLQAQIGAARPLSRIERAERRHSAALERLLVSHGHAVPPYAEAPPVPVVTDLAAACRVGASWERANVAMYDEELREKLPDDVRCVFEHLREASRDRHLPVLERCGG